MKGGLGSIRGWFHETNLIYQKPAGHFLLSFWFQETKIE